MIKIRTEPAEYKLLFKKRDERRLVRERNNQNKRKFIKTRRRAPARAPEEGRKFCLKKDKNMILKFYLLSLNSSNCCNYFLILTQTGEKMYL